MEQSLPAGRRRGAESSAVRTQLIDAAAQLIRTEGHAAVTTSRLAQAVGLKRHIIHYYFGRIEEVFVAVLRREGDRMRVTLRAALASADPLRVIWEPDNHFPPLSLEFFTMAMRHPALRDEMLLHTAEFRRMQVQAIERFIANRGIKTTVPAEAIAHIVMSISRLLAADTGVGIAFGHAATRELVEGWIDQFAGGTGPFVQS